MGIIVIINFTIIIIDIITTIIINFRITDFKTNYFILKDC